ncbi:Deuterolysin metalloprotease family-domain-containing protein [Aspergillus unguis]
MRFITPVALVALLQAANASPLTKDTTSGLQVTLSQVDNTRIKAVVENVGAEEVTFVRHNFFMDTAPVKKVSIFRNNDEVEFQGVKLRIKTTDLDEQSLTSLAPGAILEDEFDIASTSDLSSGGPVTLRSSGFVPLVSNNTVSGSLKYTSNDLTIDVDGAKAAKVTHIGNELAKRTKVTSCSGSRATALQRALSNAASLASAAASAASSGSSSAFSTFFKTTSSSTRSTVAARLRAVASEASSTSSGSTSYYCSDPYGYCESNVLAWTLPSYNIIANCDIYYTYLPALASSCYDQDQATTSLHEFTHAPGVYSPGTDDLGYGYSAATALSASQALNNADSYALFANAVYLGC